MRRKPQPTPSIEERRKPGLSTTLQYDDHPYVCKSCGIAGQGTPVTGWREADEWDQFSDDSAVVMLCAKCSDRLIEPHARLYKRLEPLGPFPGVMDICLACIHRTGTTCTNKQLLRHGGAGIRLGGMSGSRCHLNYGGGRGEFKTLWSTPPSRCSGRET